MSWTTDSGGISLIAWFENWNYVMIVTAATITTVPCPRSIATANMTFYLAFQAQFHEGAWDSVGTSVRIRHLGTK
jgi:hypothetical protein